MILKMGNMGNRSFSFLPMVVYCLAGLLPRWLLN